MKPMYKINETFYSLQGEGFYSGTPAFFIRFSGCNLSCPFCDTRHAGGVLRSLDSLLAEAGSCPARHVVLTGGEPSLFADAALTAGLHRIGKFIAIETNGTHPLPPGIDWVTLSPKDGLAPNALTVLTRCDELKVVYRGQDLAHYAAISARHRYLQPCASGDAQADRENTRATVEACLRQPEWSLSLQTHKLLAIR